MKKTIPKKIKDLEDALIPYEEFWDLWIISTGCFLKRKEADVILLYRKHQKFSLVASELGISEFSVREILNRAIRRLGWNHKLYRHWIADRMLEDSGVYDGMSEINKFLIRPLHYHPMPRLLYYSLSSLGETMGDVLKEYGEKDLLKLRNFGKKKLNFLRMFLKQNNCLYLLDKKEKQAEEIFI